MRVGGTLSRMAVPMIPLARVERFILEHDRVRLSELEHEFPPDDFGRRLLDQVLMHLLRQGDVALFPVGSEVMVRSE